MSMIIGVATLSTSSAATRQVGTTAALTDGDDVIPAHSVVNDDSAAAEMRPSTSHGSRGGQQHTCPAATIGRIPRRPPPSPALPRRKRRRRTQHRRPDMPDCPRRQDAGRIALVGVDGTRRQGWQEVTFQSMRISSGSCTGTP